MADQTPSNLPPELLAALGGQAADAGAPADPGQAATMTQQPAAPAPMAAVDQQAVCDSLMRAIQTCSEKGPGANDAREAAEYAKSALAYAQAYVAIHPGLIAPQGVPPGVLAAAQPMQVPQEENAETAPAGGGKGASA